MNNKDDNILRSSARNYLKSLRIQDPPPIPSILPSEIALLSNFRWQNRKKRRYEGVSL